MDPYRKVREGEPLNFSAQLHNDTVDAVRALKQAAGNGSPPWRPFDGGPGLTIENHGVTLDQFALAHFKAITNNADSDWQFQPLIEFDSYSAPTHKFDAGSILHTAAARGASTDVLRSYAAGIVPATIQVHSALHRFVDAPYMGSQSKFWESDWDGPHQILWKESGTGEKKALLRLGENRPRTLWGRAKEAWRKRGGLPSVIDKWAYVNVELIDYSSATAGSESDKVVRVLLPTNRDQDPNVWSNMVIGLQKYYARGELQTYSGFSMSAWPTYRYYAVTPNYVSSFIGDTKTVLGSFFNSVGWAKVDGSQNTAKTRSGHAADAREKFIFYQKNADQTGGSNTASFLSKDVIDNIDNHPNHTHPQTTDIAANQGGPDNGTIPGANTENGGAANHVALDDTHEIEIDITPAWTGAELWERIDNSAGDEE